MPTPQDRRPSPDRRETRRTARQADTHAAEAQRHHRAGILDQAERLYREALAVQPDHADSLHGLGVLARGNGRNDLAVGLIGRAIAARKEVAYYYVDLGLALRDLGHAEEARAALQVAVLRDPDDPRGHAGLALALETLGRLDDAVASLRSAVTLAPDDAQAWHRLGADLGTLGRLDEAEAAFRRTVALLPDDPSALANLGGLLFERNRLDEAADLLRQAVGAGPPTAATLSNLGLVLMAKGELVEAERLLDAAANLAPAEDAILVNRGSVLVDLGRFGDAEACFGTVEARSPFGSDVAARARFNRATVLLATAGPGRLEQGWALFESRRTLLPAPANSLPDWDGLALPNHAPLLLHAEQGLGDAIQFLRYVTLASRRARILLALPDALFGLAACLASDRCRPVRLHDSETRLCVVQASLLSLPHLLGQPAVPPFVPYLRGSPDEAASWRDWVGSLPGLKVGLSWAGSPSYRFDRRRSLKLAALAPLGGVPGVSFISLQQGEAARENPPDGMVLARPPAPLADLGATAALIEQLDLVVSVDTAIVHLAGALGRPVWLLNRFGGDWRWQDGFTGPDGSSLWYPSLRQFRQQEPLAPSLAWQDPIGRLVEALHVQASRFGSTTYTRP
ncbi:MAG: tetratricopeptide repeat protein [Janthinobacterium lividum]